MARFQNLSTWKRASAVCTNRDRYCGQLPPCRALGLAASKTKARIEISFMEDGTRISLPFNSASDTVLRNDFIHYPILTARREGDFAVVLLPNLAICDEPSYRGI